MKNRKGFTIVELVIVIAVIAILAGVLIPTFSAIIKNSKTSAALQQAENAMKQILTNTTASMPEGSAYYVNDDDDAQADYLFVFENQKLAQKNIDKNGKAEGSYPVADDNGEYTVFVSYRAFDTANATKAADLAAVESIMEAALAVSGGAWAITEKDGYNEMAFHKDAVGDPEDANYEAAVDITVKAYYTPDIQPTLVIFLAA